jgi:hypothetical protein
LSEPSKVGPFYRLPEPSKDSHGLAGWQLPKQFRPVHFHYASANPSWQFSLLNMQYPVEDIRPNAWRKIEKCSDFLTYNMNKFFFFICGFADALFQTSLFSNNVGSIQITVFSFRSSRFLLKIPF